MRFLSYTFLCISFLCTNHLAAQPCSGGVSNGYPCDNINLQSHLTLSQLGATGDGNDIWGWTDALTNKEYALMGLNNGTAFVDISDPNNPVRLGNLPTHSSNSSWRDIKVVGDYAYIVSEASGHGLQVFDLKRLRNVSNPPTTFTEDGHMTFGNSNKAHNIVANEEAGFVYLVGTSSYGSGGITAVDLSDPVNPQTISNYGSDGYTHDATCVQYRGPDQEHIGKEICIGLNASKFVILDMTDKDNIDRLSTTTYADSGYVHQGWLTDDHRYLLVNDETDENKYGQNTKTFLFDVADLDSPIFLGFHEHTTAGIDHNLYVKGRYAYMSNYRSGLRIMDMADIANGILTQTAFFDVYPTNNNRGYDGSWSNYPYFKSGNIIISSIEEGLFVVKPTFPHFNFTLNFPTIISLEAGESKQFIVDYDQYSGFSETVNLQVTNVPAELSVSLNSNTIAANGQIVVTVTAAANTTEQNYSLILEGQGNNASSRQIIALGVKVAEGDAPGCAVNDDIENDSNSNYIPADTYNVSNELTSSGSVEMGTNVIFEAGQAIVLEDGFEVENGANFVARIAACPMNLRREEVIIESRTVNIFENRENTIDIFPNPFNEQSNLTLNLVESNTISIEIFDIRGRKVETVFSNNRLLAGTHSFSLDAQNLEAGLYLLSVKIGKEVQIRKLSITKI